MNLLLDTCALIAVANGTLPNGAKRTLRTSPKAYTSSVTAWEIAIKVKSGKLKLPLPPEKWFMKLLKEYDLTALPLLSDVACEAADLPLIHRDPFDRILIATALKMNLTILTSDKKIPTYPGIQTMWAKLIE